jgi:hypothetical protein
MPITQSALYVVSADKAMLARTLLHDQDHVRITEAESEKVGVRLHGTIYLIRTASYSRAESGTPSSLAFVAEYEVPTKTLVVTSFSLGGSRPGDVYMIVSTKWDIRAVRTECAGAL